MLECFAKPENATPILLLTREAYGNWVTKQPSATQTWLESAGLPNRERCPVLIPRSEGTAEAAVYIYNEGDFWEFGNLPRLLPEGVYELSAGQAVHGNVALVWALECYQFQRFKRAERRPPKLVWPEDSHEATLAESLYWVRDMINRPANDLNPPALASEAAEHAKKYGAKVNLIQGEQLLKENFPAVYAVGKAGSTPHVIDIRWGKSSDPKVTLVGKGVCFDSGGLNLKSGPAMATMKKDMGGAAHALGLSRIIMEKKLPIQLRVIIAAVENTISKDAMRPGDIIGTRKGLTVEVGNTDAEGRLILADCLALAAEDTPELILDFATLTGAARVALGAELPALFSNDDSLSQAMLEHGKMEKDDLWLMPLWKGYRRHIEGKFADLSNESSSPYGGAITAALFLENFVDDISWAHIDMMAWSVSSDPGHPEGGDACAIRGIYSLLEERYGGK